MSDAEFLAQVTTRLDPTRDVEAIASKDLSRILDIAGQYARLLAENTDLKAELAGALEDLGLAEKAEYRERQRVKAAELEVSTHKARADGAEKARDLWAATSEKIAGESLRTEAERDDLRAKLAEPEKRRDEWHAELSDQIGDNDRQHADYSKLRTECDAEADNALALLEERDTAREDARRLAEALRITVTGGLNWVCNVKDDDGEYAEYVIPLARLILARDAATHHDDLEAGDGH